MLDWSAPSARSPSAHAPPTIAPAGRQTKAAVGAAPGSASDRSPAIVRPSAIAATSAPHAPSPADATRNGRPVRTNEYRRSDPSSSRTPATASTCGARSSRTKASWSSIAAIVRPWPPNQRASGEVVAVEPSELGRDLPVRAQLPVLIITCLTNV